MTKPEFDVGGGQGDHNSGAGAANPRSLVPLEKCTQQRSPRSWTFLLFGKTLFGWNEKSGRLLANPLGKCRVQILLIRPSSVDLQGCVGMVSV